jgi:2-amino-4-hydroxy-6-hydroxymethyldihydropteridine diphosphokinase
MASVLIALGSNYRQSAHIQWASQRLASLFTDVTVSPVLWTPDIHGRGLWYMNRLLRACTTLTVDQLNVLLKQTEQETHRTKEQVTIDLDLMQYETERYHLADWQRPYVRDLLDRDFTAVNDVQPLR